MEQGLLCVNLLFFWRFVPEMVSSELMRLLTALTDLPYAFEQPSILNLVNDFVYRYVYDNGFQEFEQSAVIYQLLMLAAASLTGQPDRRAGLPAVENYVSQNMQQPITLPDLARVLNVSVDHFSHLFRQIYGISPMQYVRLQKISRARFLLTYSNISITGIAAELGFSSQSHFSAVFRQLTGCYPTVFRRDMGSPA